MTVEEALESIGYELENCGHYCSSRALYRDGSNPKSLTIYPDKNLIIDWVTGQKFSLDQLVQATLKLSDPNQAKEWLKNKNVVINTEKEPMIDTPQIFPETWISELLPDHSYWVNRGISKEVMEEFGGGVCVNSRMKDRYVIGIRDAQNQLVGLQGRTLKDKNPRYKILGCKAEFLYPLHLNVEEIKAKKEIILVEGVGCLFSCFESKIRNVMCLFGTSLSNQQLTKLIELNVKVIISTNNDGAAGNEAARKIGSRLLKFFDKRQIEIRLPLIKDLNDMLVTYSADSIKRMYA